MILVRYYWHHVPNGKSGDGLAAFESLRLVASQMKAWSDPSWHYWVVPQAGIKVPVSLMKDSLKSMVHAGSGHIGTVPDLAWPETSIGRWRTLFDLAGAPFDETLLAPCKSRSLAPVGDEGPTP